MFISKSKKPDRSTATNLFRPILWVFGDIYSSQKLQANAINSEVVDSCYRKLAFELFEQSFLDKLNRSCYKRFSFCLLPCFLDVLFSDLLFISEAMFGGNWAGFGSTCLFAIFRTINPSKNFIMHNILLSF